MEARQRCWRAPAPGGVEELQRGHKASLVEQPRGAGLPGPSEVSYYSSRVEIHPSARKHGIVDDDIEHAMRHALAIDDQADDTRLYLGPARSADLLEVVTIVRDDGSEVVIHAMKMRPKYRRLLPEG
jgi:hypothetical protein